MRAKLKNIEIQKDEPSKGSSGLSQFKNRNIILLLSFVLADIIANLIADEFFIQTPFVEALVDSALLAIFILPSIYFLLIHPLSLQIEKRKQAEEAMSYSLSVMEAIIGSIHNAILVVSNDGTVIKTNAKFAAMWNIPSEMIFTGNDKVMLYYVLEQLANPDEFLLKVNELYRNIEAESIDEIILKDGRIFKRISKPLLFDNIPKGRVWSFLDITDRRLSEIALRNSEQKYRNIYENAQEGIFQTTTDGKYISANPALAAMYGYETPEELMNSRLDISKDAYYEPKEREHFLKIMNIYGFIKGYEYEVKHRDGHKIWFYENARAIHDENGNILYFEGFVVDITEKKLSEEEIKQKNLELQHLNATKDKFFTIIAHDLRGPFSGFLGLTKVMAEEVSTLTREEIKAISLSMKNSASNLFNLLGNLLEWSRMQRGLIPFTPEPLGVKSKIHESLNHVLEAANSKGITINYDIFEDAIVFGDPNMLESIIRNLVANAVKFTPKGGTIGISARQDSSNFVEIAVKDKGIGMSKDIIDHLFLLNFNTSRLGTDGESSTGLGLLICKDFVEMHGGRIWAESQEGQGSTLYFTMPVGAQPDMPN